MTGADRYADLIPTGQYGRLYCVSGEHARGKTFQVYVLPTEEEAIKNGPQNGPLNVGAVEVFGAVSGQLGWTETYGWKHRGLWQNDVDRLARSFELARQRKEARDAISSQEAEDARQERDRVMLASYGRGSAT